VFEARSSAGGTWNLFRYPGIRSDSDIFTYSFSWNPWPRRNTFASGQEIGEYILQSAKAAGIEKHIRFNHAVLSANWNPKDALWEVSTSINGNEEPAIYRTRFIFLGTGYYDYEQSLQVDIPGIDDFRGKVIHPQFWPEELDYAGKDIVVIGSGASAVSIVPAVAETAKHVTMLQRSPTYILPLPKSSIFTVIVFAIFPTPLALWLTRMFWVFQYQALIILCRYFPNVVRKVIRHINKNHLPPDVPVQPHFTPRYKPWEQRLCASMDGDLFAAIRSRKASVVTDTVQNISDAEIRLSSGKVLRPDIIVTATGLKLMIAGGIQFTLDDEEFDLKTKFMWKNTMLQDLPNVFFSVGSPDVSWTLLADCAAQLAVRLMSEVRRKSATKVQPSLENSEEMDVKPLLGLQSTYVKRSVGALPKAGTGIWAPRSTYFADLYRAKWGNITAGLVFK
jgi:cation diffusion facilitator CzcD-associated flavoprotein CzcO